MQRTYTYPITLNTPPRTIYSLNRDSIKLPLGPPSEGVAQAAGDSGSTSVCAFELRNSPAVGGGFYNCGDVSQKVGCLCSAVLVPLRFGRSDGSFLPESSPMKCNGH